MSSSCFQNPKRAPRSWLASSAASTTDRVAAAAPASGAAIDASAATSLSRTRRPALWATGAAADGAACAAWASRMADATLARLWRSLGVGLLRAERESLPGRDGIVATRGSRRGVCLRPCRRSAASRPPSVSMRRRGWRVPVGAAGASALARSAKVRWRDWRACVGRCAPPAASPAVTGASPASSASAAPSESRSYMRRLSLPSAMAIASSEASWSPSPSRSPPSAQSAASAALRRRSSRRTALAAAAEAPEAAPPRLVAERAPSSDPCAMPALTASVLPTRATAAALPPRLVATSGRPVMRSASPEAPWGRARGGRGAPCRPRPAWLRRPRRAWC